MGDTVYGDKVKGNKLVFHTAGGRRHRPVVLLLSANPEGTDPLMLDEERRAIVQSIAAAGDSLEVSTADALRLEDLLPALVRSRPAIVQFSGHGSAVAAGLVVGDADGYPYTVPPRALTELFRSLDDRPHCVVFNVCYTEEQARAVAAHVPCVVGMHSRILDRTAIRFAAGFYTGVAHGTSIRSAFDLARSQLLLHRDPGDRVPALIAAPGAAERRIVGGR